MSNTSPLPWIRSSRVAIVGGSIAGCAAAIALSRVGAEVTVFERSRGALQDRGFGVGLPGALWERFVEAGYLDSDMPIRRCDERLWIVADGSDRGRIAWRQPFPMGLNNWGLLWRALRANIPAEVTWRAGVVTESRVEADGCALIVDGKEERFDIVVGADGGNSAMRALVGASPARYAGYSLWRGNYPVSRLASANAEFDDSMIGVMFSGGHGVCYRIPGLWGGEDTVNWAVYGSWPSPARNGHVFVPPGAISDVELAELDRIARTHLPPYWADLINRTHRAEFALQPVYDHLEPCYVVGRVLLTGDAGALARQHTGLGVSKAIQDAMALEQACREHEGWDQVLAAYDRDRRAYGRAAVDLGRRLGVAQVDRTPQWDTMAPTDFESWFAALMNGKD